VIGTPVVQGMKIDAGTRLIGLLGWPVGHSLSPIMQQAALRAAGINAVYIAMPTPPARLNDALAGLHAIGAIGANVTVPHKETVLQMGVRPVGEATWLGSVNTLIPTPEGWDGYNTDAPAFMDVLREEANVRFTGFTYAQLGAGGTGRALALAVARSGVRRMILANRTRDRADILAQAIRAIAPKTLVVETISAATMADVEPLKDADVVVNTTSLGLQQDDPSPLPAAAFRKGQIAIDCLYHTPDTPFLLAARKAGCQTLDGLSMLVRQGAMAFTLWTGQAPDAGLMRDVAATARAERLGITTT